MTILVVDAEPSALATSIRLLADAGHHVVAATSFEEASAKLSSVKPDAIVADIRLGAYNGLHLVFRARIAFPQVAAFVTHSVPDRVLEADAEAAGVVYLVKPLTPETFLPRLREELAKQPEATLSDLRKWPRKATNRPWSAHIGSGDARVIDISYGGLKLESTESGGPPACDSDIVMLPDAGVALRARCVWRKRLESQKTWTGIELADRDPRTVETWRRFVDRA